MQHTWEAERRGGEEEQVEKIEERSSVEVSLPEDLKASLVKQWRKIASGTRSNSEEAEKDSCRDQLGGCRRRPRERRI